MAKGIRLIAGLGNPGSSYAETRHNAGFRFIEQLISRVGGALKAESKFSGQAAKVNIAGQDVWLLKPDTFMNNSGDSVAAAARFYKVEPEEVLVVHDELDLSPGTVRLKTGGGHGGHNGLRDIIPKLGSKEFVRLRIGIGHPGSASQVAAFVLKKAPPAEQELTDEAIARAISHIEDIVAGDHERVMNDLHTHS